MSGIVGAYRYDGDAIDPGLVDRLTARLAHRGLDGEGRWNDRHVGLGHQHLVTTPESRGERQPTVQEAENGHEFVLTADARLDNREALCRQLDIGTGVADAKLLLAAYDRWGRDCVDHLLGAFAFTLWDPTENRLLCARDHLGVKPVYYADGPERFVVGSEPKVPLADPAVRPTLDERRVADHLTRQFDDRERTFYTEIKRLPPAHTLTVGPDGISKRRYWSLDPSHMVRLESDEAYAQAFLDIFRDAVRCRLRSAGPVGSLLSGGLDSSSITCTARRELDDVTRLHTVSAVFDDVPESDEREYIETVLESAEFTPHFVRADTVGPLSDVDVLHWHHDEPNHAPNHFVYWHLYRAARQNGVRVLLDGLDGDTTVSHGRGRMAELAKDGHWLRLVRELTRFSRHFDRPIRNVTIRRVLGPLAPEPVARLWRRGRPGRRQPGVPNPTIADDFAERIDLRDRLDRGEANHPGSPPLSKANHYESLTDGVIPLSLENLDRSAAAFGIEPRYPFFDKRLVEFCYGLPADQSLQDGWTRIVLRRAMEGILPHAIQWRGGKADLTPNFNRGLREFHGKEIDQTIQDSTSTVADYLDLEALREVYDGFSSEDDDSDVMTLWAAVSLDCWLRDRPPTVHS